MGGLVNGWTSRRRVPKRRRFSPTSAFVVPYPVGGTRWRLFPSRAYSDRGSAGVGTSDGDVTAK